MAQRLNKLSNKKKLSVKLSKEQEKENRFSCNFYDSAEGCFIGAGIVGFTGGLIGSMVGDFGIANGLYQSKLDAGKTEIGEEFLKIAQDKATQFNEKFNETISVPELSGNVQVVGNAENGVISATSDAIEQVRYSISSMINDKMLVVKAGETNGQITGFSHGTITGTDGEILVKTGYQDWVIERGQFLQNELGTSLDNQMVEIANNVVQSSNEVFVGVLTGIGLGIIPGVILAGIPIYFWARGKIAGKKALKYEKEYKELCAKEKQTATEQQNMKEEADLER